MPALVNGKPGVGPVLEIYNLSYTGLILSCTSVVSEVGKPTVLQLVFVH